jgi:hypothetical protein
MEVVMRIHRLSHHDPHIVHPHPHAHQIGMAAVLVALIGMPLAFTVVLPVLAIILGVIALMLSLHPAKGMDAKPEAWVAIVTGIIGLIFGAAQLLFMIHL